MNIEDIKKIIQSDETRTLELKKSTGELKDGMHSACAMLNGDGGWLVFGITPKSLKIQGQMVTDNTRQDIANALTGLDPSVDVRVEYIDVPDSKIGEQVIAMHFDGWVKGMHPYTFRGCPYYKPESITKVMPQDMYEERLKECDPFRFAWENKYADVQVVDLDEKRIKDVVRLGVESGRLPATAIASPIEEVLSKLNLMENGRLRNAAVMLFGRNFSDFPQLMVRMACFRGQDKSSFIDNQRMKGNFFDLLDSCMSFLFKHLSLGGTIKGLIREEQLEIPVLALRECLINALCHREYDSLGGSVSIAIYDDRIEIINPGQLPKGLTPQNIKLPHDSCPRNPVIADVLYLSAFLESWGSGVNRMVNACREANLEEPEYETNVSGVTVIFKRNKNDRQNDRQNEIVKSRLSMLSDRQQQILTIINDDRQISAENIGRRLDISSATVYREIKKINLVIQLYWDGPAKTGHWVVVEVMQ